MLTNMDYKMKKNIVVTGAGRGIGYEICMAASAQGHRVYALSRNVKSLENTGVIAQSLDITKDEDIESFAKELEHQGVQIDVLINNAGLLANLPFSQTDGATFEAVYQVNVFGLAALTRSLLPLIPKEGHVVSISSMGGKEGSAKFAGLSAYSSSKAAVNILTELLAEEYKETGPSFNALALGAVQTEMLAAAFPGYEAPLTAEEMGAYVLQFALEGNRYFNGKVLGVSSMTP